MKPFSNPKCPACRRELGCCICRTNRAHKALKPNSIVEKAAKPKPKPRKR